MLQNAKLQGLPYTETMSVSQAAREGYTLVDMYTMQPYNYDDALKNLTSSLSIHILMHASPVEIRAVAACSPELRCTRRAAPMASSDLVA